MTDHAALLERIDRIESRQEIAELPARYAIAVDARDIDGWLALFVEDVDCGRFGRGREALRKFIDPAVRGFYRSVHMICGQTVNFIDKDTAEGTVYCRAEHEDGSKWVVMAIIYFDRYVRRNGEWFFERRKEKHWYSVDALERPAPPFQLWDRYADLKPRLPADFPTWSDFWKASPKGDIASLSAAPISDE